MYCRVLNHCNHFRPLFTECSTYYCMYYNVLWSIILINIEVFYRSTQWKSMYSEIRICLRTNWCQVLDLVLRTKQIVCYNEVINWIEKKYVLNNKSYFFKKRQSINYLTILLYIFLLYIVYVLQLYIMIMYFFFKV